MIHVHYCTPGCIQSNVYSQPKANINTHGEKYLDIVFTLNQITLHEEVVLHVLKTLSLYFKTNLTWAC